MFLNFHTKEKKKEMKNFIAPEHGSEFISKNRQKIKFSMDGPKNRNILN